MGSGPGGKLKLRLLYGALSATLLVAPAMLGVSAIQVSAAKGGVNDAHPAGASNASSAPATSNAGGNGNAVAGANSNAGNAVAGANSNASANGATNGVGSDKQADALSSGTAAATSSSSTVSSAPVSAPAAAKPAGGIDPKGGSGGAGNGNLPAPNKTGPGDKNKGDVWVDTVGAAPGPGHEMDPHLPCADINLWGAGLADTSGTFTIDGWPPSGHKAQAYPASGTLPWNYTAGSGTQNLLLAGASDPYTADADIDVDKLIANATSNGDAPVNKQGFHFKLQFSQDPQKHKTFWVDCPAPAITPPPPPPPPAPVLKPQLSIVKTVSPAGTVPVGTELTYTITVTNSGNAAAQDVVSVDQVAFGQNSTAGYQVVAGSFSSPNVVSEGGGFYIWRVGTVAAGGSASLTFNVVVTSVGTLNNAAAVGGPPPTPCVAPLCSEVTNTVVAPPQPGFLESVIYKVGTTHVVPGGSLTLVGGATRTSYPTTFGPLTPGQYCVNESTPPGWTLVSSVPAMTSPGQACNQVLAGQTAHIIFYVTQGTSAASTQSACVASWFDLLGTSVMIPGGLVTINSSGNQVAPFTACNLAVGPATANAVSPPAGYLIAPGTPTTLNETLKSGNNPPMIFFVTLPASGVQGAICGELLGNIVLVGTQHTVPGGTITEAGQPAVTNYPGLLGPCQAPGQVSVSATPPPGFSIVGPSQGSKARDVQLSWEEWQESRPRAESQRRR